MEHKTIEYFGETKEIIERDATAEEIDNLEKRNAKLEALEIAKAEKAAAKAELLERLGITAEEAKLLLS